jgi:phenylalanine-4-hydroxylase
MKQDMLKYGAEDIRIWNYLFENQYHNIQDKVCWEYLDCTQKLSRVLNPHEIPDFEKLNSLLFLKTGWNIHVVPGLIDANDFFEHLKNKRFCASTWLRSEKELHYIEEPDMFHDVFGHIPLFMNQDYADFAQKIGALALLWKNDEAKIRKIQRLYWFTIEFGVIRRKDKLKSYGAGIISSIEEVNKIHQLKGEFRDYDITEILQREYNINTVQPCYYVINSFAQLYDSLHDVDQILKKIV